MGGLPSVTATAAALSVVVARAFDLTSFHSLVVSSSCHSIPEGGAGSDSRGRGCLGANNLDIFHGNDTNDTPSSSAMAANAIFSELLVGGSWLVSRDEKQSLFLRG
jgi:hypothetical protein